MHNVIWSATASAVSSVEVIENSLSWLTGELADISHEKVKSYHGAKMVRIHARISKKKAAKQSIAFMGSELLKNLADSGDLKMRIDGDNVLHIRLSLSSLVSGSIAPPKGNEEQVKGRIKLEVYPGQDFLENAKSLLNDAADFANENGFPREFENV